MIACLRMFTNRNLLVQFKESKKVGSAGERNCWSTDLLLLGPQTTRSSRNKVGTN